MFIRDSRHLVLETAKQPQNIMDSLPPPSHFTTKVIFFSFKVSLFFCAPKSAVTYEKALIVFHLSKEHSLRIVASQSSLPNPSLLFLSVFQKWGLLSWIPLSDSSGWCNLILLYLIVEVIQDLLLKFSLVLSSPLRLSFRSIWSQFSSCEHVKGGWLQSHGP